MDTVSLWQASADAEKDKFPELTEEIEVDVVIIGGGITGLTAARYLTEAGKKVAVLEAFNIGDGTTGNSTGNLYIETQPYFQNIEKKFSAEIAKKIAYSRKLAIDEIEKTVKENDIDCNFSRRPWYLFTDDQDQIAFLDKEVETLKQLEVYVDYVDTLSLPFRFKKAASMENQARFHPVKYVKGLAKNLESQGCHIYENSRVNDISEKEIATVTTPKGKVSAKKIIIATHTPKGINHTQMYSAPYRSYVIAVRFKEGNYPEGHFWGIGEQQNISSTHAVSSDNQPEFLLVAGRHHKTGQSKDENKHFKELAQYLKNQEFPSFEIVHQWSAQHYQSADDVPYIGLASKSSKNTYIATGYFADGLIYGVIAGKVLSDLIVKGGDQQGNIYDPNRDTLTASLAFLVKENTNVFLQYLKDLPFVASKQYQDLKPGEGRIVEIDNQKCAVCRDEHNHLHAVSAVCTHMKCIVQWNNAEQTWDCPCHGSRFSPDGQVLEGPALTDLEKKNI